MFPFYATEVNFHKEYSASQAVQTDRGRIANIT